MWVECVSAVDRENGILTLFRERCDVCSRVGRSSKLKAISQKITKNCDDSFRSIHESLGTILSVVVAFSRSSSHFCAMGSSDVRCHSCDILNSKKVNSRPLNVRMPALSARTHHTETYRNVCSECTQVLFPTRAQESDCHGSNLHLRVSHVVYNIRKVRLFPMRLWE